MHSLLWFMRIGRNMWLMSSAYPDWFHTRARQYSNRLMLNNKAAILIKSSPRRSVAAFNRFSLQGISAACTNRNARLVDLNRGPFQGGQGGRLPSQTSPPFA